MLQVLQTDWEQLQTEVGQTVHLQIASIATYMADFRMLSLTSLASIMTCRDAANDTKKAFVNLTVGRAGLRGRPEAAAADCGVPKRPPVAGWLAQKAAAPVAAPNRAPVPIMPPVVAELDCPKAAAEANKPAGKTSLRQLRCCTT